MELARVRSLSRANMRKKNKLPICFFIYEMFYINKYILNLQSFRKEKTRCLALRLLILSMSRGNCNFIPSKVINLDLRELTSPNRILSLKIADTQLWFSGNFSVRISQCSIIIVVVIFVRCKHVFIVDTNRLFAFETISNANNIISTTRTETSRVIYPTETVVRRTLQM